MQIGSAPDSDSVDHHLQSVPMDGESLPLEDIRSHAKFAIVDKEKKLISEHNSTPDAVRALTSLQKELPAGGILIYRRVGQTWKRY